MATTYKYQQNLADGASAGYVQYNVTPDFDTVLAVGETFEVTGKLYCGNLKRYGIAVTGQRRDGNWDVELGWIRKECNRYRTITFSVQCTVKEDLWYPLNGAMRRLIAPISFLLYDNSDYSGGESTVNDDAAQQYILLQERLAPVVNAVTISDATGAYAHFGGAVRGKSDLTYTLDVEYDPLDESSHAIQAASVNFGRIAMDYGADRISGNQIHVGTLDFDGMYVCTMSITDAKGMTATARVRTVTVYDYAAPTLAALADTDVAQRYSVSSDDSGGEVVKIDDAGEYLLATFATTVQPINGKNAWTVSRAYAEYGAALPDGVVCISEPDGGEYSVWQDQSIFPRSIQFAANKRYTVQFILKDYFESATLVFDVDKAGGYFNVEKYGVAAGMRSTATPENPMFESAWPIVGYAGIKGISNYAEGEERTYGKWIDGKNVYRKLVPVTVNSTSAVVDVANISGIETVVRIDGCYIDTSGAAYPPSYFATTNNYISTHFAGETLRIRSTRALTGFAVLYYTKANDDPDAPPTEKTVIRPAAAMTSNSSQGCVASASSQYNNSSYAAWRAFNKSYSDQYGWATANGTREGWIQLEMDVALKQISVTIINRTFEYVHGPENGVIYGSNDGEEWQSIGTFGGRDGDTSALKTVYECNNDEIAYRYVRINVSRSADPYVAVGEIIIEGEVS